MIYPILLVLAHMNICWAAPVDDPIRVDLPVYEPKPSSSPGVALVEPLEAENHPGIQNINRKPSIVGNLISSKFSHSSDSQDPHIPAGFAGGFFNAPVTTREGALQEAEGWGSKTLSIKENVQGVVAGFLQPKPIVDTITEEEKYGNTGDKFYSAGRAVVGGASGLSNLVNSVIQIPGNIFRQITRAASEKLNNLGGKIIGLN